ncbi:MAG: CDGSH iron-sulfur domain-containing protein [Phycisphaerae bacterium]
MAAPKRGDRPIKIEETAGRKAYCMCGWSENLPYCDGAHSRNETGCEPIVCEVPEDGRKSICQCGLSQTLPWCDGAHKALQQS